MTAATETGYPAAIRATRERAIRIIGEEPGTTDGAASARVVQALNEPGFPHLADADFARDRHLVGVRSLEKRGPRGRRAVPLLVVADELAAWLGGRDVELHAFADALTAFVAVCQDTDDLTGREHVVHALRVYLAGRRQNPDPGLSVPRKLLLGAAERWERLADRIPWVRWLAPEDHDPIGGVRVDPPALVDLLVLLRPRLEQKYADDGPADRGLPERFARLYRCDVEPGHDDLQSLAGALGVLLCDAGRAERSLQPLRLPSALEAAVDARLRAAQKTTTNDEDLLAVRVDPRRVLLVNLSPRCSLQMHVGDREVRLPPNAVDESGAAGYCSEPIEVGTGAEVRVGRWRVPLDVEEVPLEEGANFTLSALPPDLFRGRELQQAMLRGAMAGRGPRAGSLIFGPRRAGKSTLMEHVGLDPRLRLSISLDVANAVDRAQDFAEWNRKITRKLAGLVAKRLGVTLDTSEGDLVGLLDELDEELTGSAPVGLLLDEFDTLLLPEQGGGGLRIADRLGNRAFHNLVIMGTVQRFHRNTDLFKNWRRVECPADLSWPDAVTYFLGPLHRVERGGRTEWLTRSGVTPRDVADEVVPRVGLRPYFWGQLRGYLEAAVRVPGARSRLADADLVRAACRSLITEDAHLNSVLEDGARMDPAERRRHDLFGDDERRILLCFATMDAVGSTLSVKDAQRAGGEAAVKELVDRAWLTYNESQTRLRTAVPIYHSYLRSRVSDLREVTPAEAPAATRPRSLGAPATRSTSATRPAGRSTGAGAAPPAMTRTGSSPSAESPRKAGATSTERTPPAGASAPGQAGAPGARPRAAGPKTASEKTVSTPPEAQDSRPGRRAREHTAATGRTQDVTRNGRRESASTPSWRPSTDHGPSPSKRPGGTPKPTATTQPAAQSHPRPAQPEKAKRGGDAVRPSPATTRSGEPTAVELRIIRSVLQYELTMQDPLPLSTAGNVIRQAVPRIGPGNSWAGAGRLTDFVEIHLPELTLEDNEAGRVVRSTRGRLRRLLDRIVPDSG